MFLHPKLDESFDGTEESEAGARRRFALLITKTGNVGN